MNEIQLEKELCITTLKTLTVLFAEKYWPDAVALYFFYYKQCKLQQTNQARSTKSFCLKWLWRWETKFRRAKNILKKYNIIEDIKNIDEKTKKINGRYIKLNYINSTSTPPKKAEGGKSLTVENDPPNAYINRDKCFNKIKEKEKEKKENFSPSLPANKHTNEEGFEEFRKIYPRRVWKQWAKKKYLIATRQEWIHEKIIEWVKKYKEEYEKKKSKWIFCPDFKNPETRLNKWCWDDEYDVSMEGDLTPENVYNIFKEWGRGWAIIEKEHPQIYKKITPIFKKKVHDIMHKDRDRLGL